MNASLAIRAHMSWGPFFKILGAIALALITAVMTYAFTARLNVDNVAQQQRVSVVQQFEESGAKMDANLSLLVDAILSEKGSEGVKAVDAARSESRTSITLHASQARALESLIGQGNVRQYTDRLGELRRLTDKVSGRMTAKRMAQLHVNLMDYRVRMLAMARSNIYRPSRIDRWTTSLVSWF